jgi:hypothetical protein
MTNLFLDRLLERAGAIRQNQNVKPQFTPEMIPETFAITQAQMRITRHLLPAEFDFTQGQHVEEPRPEQKPNMSAAYPNQSKDDKPIENIPQESFLVPRTETADMIIESGPALKRILAEEPKALLHSRSDRDKDANGNGAKAAKPETAASRIISVNENVEETLVLPVKEGLGNEQPKTGAKIGEISRQQTQKANEDSDQNNKPAAGPRMEALNGSVPETEGAFAKTRPGVSVARITSDNRKEAANEVLTVKGAARSSHIEETQVRPAIKAEDKSMITINKQIIDAREAKAGFSTENAEPTVTISIGRIEVRAMMPEKSNEQTRRPALPLEEYLKRRQEGSL